jgi:zinc protease
MLSRHDNPWSKDDIRYQPSFEESIASVTELKRDLLVTFHKNFYGAAQVSAAAVGSFDPASMESTLTQALNQWAAGASYTRLPNPYRDIKPVQMQALTPDKANAFYTAAMPLKMQDTDPDFAALSLANFLLGTSETSRLWMRVREKEGLSYNVRTRLNVSAFEPTGSWGVYAIFSPENRTKVEAAIREEFERVIKEGFGEAEVQDGIKALLNYRKLARAQDSAWLVARQRGHLQLCHRVVDIAGPRRRLRQQPVLFYVRLRPRLGRRRRRARVRNGRLQQRAALAQRQRRRRAAAV